MNKATVVKMKKSHQVGSAGHIPLSEYPQTSASSMAFPGTSLLSPMKK